MNQKHYFHSIFTDLKKTPRFIKFPGEQAKLKLTNTVQPVYMERFDAAAYIQKNFTSEVHLYLNLYIRRQRNLETGHYMQTFLVSKQPYRRAALYYETQRAVRIVFNMGSQ